MDTTSTSSPLIEAFSISEEVREKAILIQEGLRSITDPDLLTYKHIKAAINVHFPHGTKKPEHHIPEIIQRLYYAATKRVIQLLFRSGQYDELDLNVILSKEPLVSDESILTWKEDDPPDYRRLQRFTRAVYIASKIMHIPGGRNRDRYVYLATQLEGAGRSYANGGARAKSCKLRHHVIDILTKSKRGRRNRMSNVVKGILK